MAQPHFPLRLLLAASLAFSLACAQTLLVQVHGRGVNIARPGVGFPLSGRLPAGSRYEEVAGPGEETTYEAPAGFDPPVNATVARAVLDALEVRDPAVDGATRTVEVRRRDVGRVSVLFQCPDDDDDDNNNNNNNGGGGGGDRHGVLVWAPLYHVVWGDVVPGGETFRVWFVEANLPGGSPLASEYRVDCLD